MVITANSYTGELVKAGCKDSWVSAGRVLVVLVACPHQMQVDQEARPRRRTNRMLPKKASELQAAEALRDSSRLRCRLSLKGKDRAKEDKVLKARVSTPVLGSVALGVA